MSLEKVRKLLVRTALSFAKGLSLFFSLVSTLLKIIGYLLELVSASIALIGIVSLFYILYIVKKFNIDLREILFLIKIPGLNVVVLTTKLPLHSIYYLGLLIISTIFSVPLYILGKQLQRGLGEKKEKVFIVKLDSGGDNV